MNYLSLSLLHIVLVPGDLRVLHAGLGHELREVLLFGLGDGFGLHLEDEGAALGFDGGLDGLDGFFEALDGGVLVSSVRAEDVERGRDEFSFDRDCVGALLFTRAEGFLDRVDAGGGVACELDVRAELDGLGREAAGDGRCEEGEGRCGDRVRER